MKNERFPAYISKEKYEKVMNLLLYQEHILISDFNKFMYNHSKLNEKLHFCLYCLQCLSTEENVELLKLIVWK